MKPYKALYALTTAAVIGVSGCIPSDEVSIGRELSSETQITSTSLESRMSEVRQDQTNDDTSQTDNALGLIFLGGLLIYIGGKVIAGPPDCLYYE